VAAVRERIALRHHPLHDCSPCGEIACEPCVEIVAQPCQEVACEPCQPCDDICARPGFFSRLRSRLAALRPIRHYGCEPCQPICEVEPACEPCQPIPCVPCK
jgi:hypothetical protein